MIARPYILSLKWCAGRPLSYQQCSHIHLIEAYLVTKNTRVSPQINAHMIGKGTQNTEGKIRSVPFYYLSLTFIHLANI